MSANRNSEKRKFEISANQNSDNKRFEISANLNSDKRFEILANPGVENSSSATPGTRKLKLRACRFSMEKARRACL